MSVSRDPSDYHPTTHAGQRAKERNIAFDDVATTIRDGERRDAMGEDCWLFVHEIDDYDRPIGVHVDASTGSIITIEYRT